MLKLGASVGAGKLSKIKLSFVKMVRPDAFSSICQCVVTLKRVETRQSWEARLYFPCEHPLVSLEAVLPGF